MKAAPRGGSNVRTVLGESDEEISTCKHSAAYEEVEAHFRV